MSNVFRYNKILIDCVFGNSEFVVPSTLTIDLGFASSSSSSNKVQATVVDYRTGACGARKTVYR
jgi:hypothetical protein